nr:MAG TPA: Protein of unknown function (DUF551) [Caudoviricetes sp.]
MSRGINMDMICKCGSKKFFTEKHGNQTGLYCSACGKWQKWLKKDEIRLFNHGVQDGWISVKDRLPDTDRKVLVYDLNSGCYVMSRRGNEWNVLPTLRPRITHWRELPDPPRKLKG